MPRALAPLLAAAVLVSIAAPRAARAQIVDVQSLIGKDIPGGASGKLEAQLDWRTGNTRVFHAGGTLLARYRRGAHLGFALVRGEYNETAGKDMPLVTSVAKAFAHVRYRWQVTTPVAAEAFVQDETDRFRRLRTRALAGAGVRVRVAECERWAVNVGLALMVEHEQLTSDGLAGAGARTTDARASSYAVGTYAFNDKVTASETVYVQPRLTDPEDVRLLEEAALTSKLTDKIAFRAAFTLAHDSRPPPDTARTDSAVQTGVSISF